MTDSAPVVLCGSLSLHPVSLGAAMHQAGYTALGLNYTYVPFRVTELEGALAGMRALGIRGFGVSMPFKVAIMPLLDRIDPLAERIGAVNTVVNDDGVLTGYNTDATGACRALEEKTSIQGKRVLSIGAGGAARAVDFGLCQKGARLHIINRTQSKAAQLALDLRQAFPEANISSGPLDDARDLSQIDIVVNCSSAGMSEYGDESVISVAAIHGQLTIMDIVYKPIETALVRRARAKGVPVIHGGRMLLHQAAGQFELYTGRKAPVDAMNEALQGFLVPSTEP